MNPAQLSNETERDSATSLLTMFPAAGSTLSVGSSTSPLAPATDRSSSLESEAGRSLGSGTLTPIVDIDVLYRAREVRSSHFSGALELLARASGILDLARQAAHDGNPLESDNQFLQFQALLPRLFECRTIGEGFANIINAIQIGIANLKGQPLDAAQVNAVWRAVRQLTVGPFITFESSLDTLEDLEEAGISVRNSFISEWLSEASSFGAHE